MVIEERAAGDPGLAALLDAAFAELVARYGPEGRSGVHERARFLVARVGDEAVGCGAVQPAEPGVAELKRMYVAPAFRGRGIARGLLAALEDLARAMEYRALRLATGLKQPEAIALYESSGYTLTPPYGKYVRQPATRCYLKELARC
ncbi:GNAT superfamily N-acetyltransferase [Thermocatellispora tengchongensis]|uniref:GNAT superfamily N-acetyltransferase n=1 Tax=Thermocatellispora tengchongensis TaxID=1073253 RepID=A0A840PLX3_9ACTN|nr:GNAT family N-acetyltransferase [Thermocatellispora tengchongensis]MBB5138640.1 GNAT superfamily N-acetyltransferase [Thermocatellispora tengchongensis]